MYKKLLDIARRNVAENPHVGSVEDYLQGIVDEIAEVRAECTPDNHVHLQDELSDIMWDYANLLALCERDGIIENVEAVFAHGVQKYTQRLPAMMTGSTEQWVGIKKKQKAALADEHNKHYGEE